MANQTITKKIKAEYCKMLHLHGEEGFYQKSVGVGLIKSTEIKNIDTEILNLSEGFLSLYRRTADVDCLMISKVLRRVAHVMYRHLLKTNKTKKTDNKRFLTLVA